MRRRTSVENRLALPVKLPLRLRIAVIRLNLSLERGVSLVLGAWNLELLFRLRSTFQRDHAVRNRKFRQSCDRMNIEPAHNPFAMGFDRAHADPKLAGDFLV